MNRFLPESTPGTEYSTPDSNPEDFSSQRGSLIEEIGRIMKVDKAGSEGRVPSPFSPAYMFHVYLYGYKRGAAAPTSGATGTPTVPVVRADLAAYRDKAKGIFRGICAAFALREVLGLDIKLKRMDPAEANPGGDPEGIRRVLYSCMHTAPPAKVPDFWNPIRFYTVSARLSVEEEVVAGLSPLTGFFPSASRMRNFTALFWYDHKGVDLTRQWYDPTTEFRAHDPKPHLRASEETIREIRKLMRFWLDNVKAAVGIESLADFGLNSEDAGLLFGELEIWRQELPAVNPLEELGLSGLDHSPIEQGFPLFDWVVPGKARRRSLITELPVQAEAVIITRELAASSGVRLFGGQRGSADLAAKLDELEPFGEDLAQALQMHTYGAPLRYVLLEKLFSPTLAAVTSEGISEGWTGLDFQSGPRKISALFPFHPDLLKIFPPKEIKQRTKVIPAGQPGSEMFTVLFRYGDLPTGEGTPDWEAKTIRRVYAKTPAPDQGQGRYDLETLFPGKIDVRLFPDFDLHAQLETEQGYQYLIREEKDRAYYFRVRRSPYWTFQVELLVRDRNGELIPSRASTTWNGTADMNGKKGLTDCAEFLKLEFPDYPIGFSVEGMGFSLCTLVPPGDTGAQMNAWEVAADFGTTSTCVTYLDVRERHTHVLNFPTLTSNFLREPNYNQPFNPPAEGEGPTVNDGAAATLEFFDKLDANHRVLNDDDSFPTQFITTHPVPFADAGETIINPRNGMVYFKNITLTQAQIPKLIEQFPRVTAKEDKGLKARFLIRDNLKWPHQDDSGQFKDGNTIWREPFMVHLRLAVVLSAARKGARVTRARFSYPKALPSLYVGRYKSILKRIWAAEIRESDQARLLVTESEAVSNFLVNHKPHHEYLVLDIGGGTTDILAIFNEQPFCQASVMLAGGEIKDYVLKSQAFRDALINASRKHLPPDLSKLLARIMGSKKKASEDADPDGAASGESGSSLPDLNKDEVIKQFRSHAWGALLQKITDRQSEILNSLRDPSLITEGGAKAAIRGYFLSLSVMLGAVTYLGGRLMGLKLNQDKDASERGLDIVTMWMLGNGAKFCAMLSEDDAQTVDGDISSMMRNMFRAGLEYAGPLKKVPTIKYEGIPLVDNKRRPKAVLALGLLLADANAARPLPYAKDPADDDYYDNLKPKTHRTEEFPAEIKYFLEKLDDNLRKRLNDSAIPFRPKSNGRTQHLGIFNELKAVYTHDQVRAFISKFEVKNAKFRATALSKLAADAGGPKPAASIDQDQADPALSPDVSPDRPPASSGEIEVGAAQTEIPDEDFQAVESLFVTRVRGLLYGIAEIYGAGESYVEPS
jgi:hypothetical protein